MSTSGESSPKKNKPTPSTSSTNSPPSAAPSAASLPSSPTTATSSAPRDGSRASPILHFMPSQRLQELAKKRKTEIAASTSSMAATTIAYPLDFVKSRMQGYNIDAKTAIRDAYQKEGLRAFWRGVMPPIVSIALVRSLSFKFYQDTKYYLDQRFFDLTGRSPLVLASTPGRFPTIDTVACHGLAGMLAGGGVTFLSCPFELVKINAQLAGKELRDRKTRKTTQDGSAANGETKTSSKKNSPGSLRLFAQQIKKGGLTRAYAGYPLHLFRDTLGTGTYFVTYETTKQILLNFSDAAINPIFAIPIAGGLCGMSSWAVIIPIDAAKTSYQKARLAADPGVKVPFPRIGYFQRKSYRGLGVACTRSAAINMIFFSIYEHMKYSVDRFVGADDEVDRNSRNNDVD